MKIVIKTIAQVAFDGMQNMRPHAEKCLRAYRKQPKFKGWYTRLSAWVNGFPPN